MVWGWGLWYVSQAGRHVSSQRPSNSLSSCAPAPVVIDWVNGGYSVYINTTLPDLSKECLWCMLLCGVLSGHQPLLASITKEYKPDVIFLGMPYGTVPHPLMSLGQWSVVVKECPLNGAPPALKPSVERCDWLRPLSRGVQAPPTLHVCLSALQAGV